MSIQYVAPDGTTQTLATTVEYAETWLQQAVGLIGQHTLSEDYALVFPFDKAKRRRIHTVGVRTAIDVIWIVESAVTQVKTLPAWRGLASATADTVIEVAAGTAHDIKRGDSIVMEQYK